MTYFDLLFMCSVCANTCTDIIIAFKTYPIDCWRIFIRVLE